MQLADASGTLQSLRLMLCLLPARGPCYRPSSMLWNAVTIRARPTSSHSDQHQLSISCLFVLGFQQLPDEDGHVGKPRGQVAFT